ncbi:hypothetical protein BT96DRAFT_1101625 [Gymnopus androsaceus JB14]|uniref:Golgi apparatus membrane protein TVP38 n=1 Tax=Gymnopus androsaceus JB14 TaxID=1447944 RepID=A0A6A4HNS4_9AGAR|nr:hypothetical protein BT96DRAFT_1101625 [Gymnopus androsaceus JB14]
MSLFSNLLCLALAALSVQAQDTTVQVQVGGTVNERGGIYQFTPSNFNANNGSVISFEFTGNPGNHSITQSTFSSPCQPLSGGFDSGWVLIPNGGVSPSPVWNLTVTDDSNRMVGAINAPTSGSNSFDSFLNNAESSTTSGQQVGALVGQGASASAIPGPLSSGCELDNVGSSGIINWKLIKSKDFWFSKEGLKYGLTAAVIITIVVLFIIYHKTIVIALEPATQWCHDQKFGWLIPVGILFVLSFPPLFGHEIIGMLCGIAWGIGEGFAIVALGTLLGEVANFFTFKYCCTSRAQKYEKKKISYACLARVVRAGGFKIAVAARFSLIPPHLTTTVFASSGMSFPTFVAAAICSLPKQFVTVVTGVLLEDSINGTSKKEKIASIAVAIVSGIVTSFALRYVNRKMDEIKPQVIYERRKARQNANLKMLSEDNAV